MKRILFIVNPISGIEGKQHLPRLVASYINQDLYRYEITYTQYRHHARDIARSAVQRQFDAVVAVGGDGSINEIASQLVGSRVALGIVPLGSGNGLARKLGIYTPRIPEAISTLNHFFAKAIDVGVANEQYFFSNAGVGAEADVVHDYAKVKTRGLWSYARLGYQHTFSHQAPEYHISLPDGTVLNRRCFLINVSNAGQYGYGVGFTPQSDLSDGLLELTMVRDFKIRTQAALLAALTALKRPEWSGLLEVIPLAKCTITTEQAVALQLDGDPAPASRNLVCSVLPQALRVLVQPPKV